MNQSGAFTSRTAADTGFWRRLPIVAAGAAFAAGYGGFVQALSLGEVESISTLGQALRLDIPIDADGGESLRGLQVSVRARPLLAAQADGAWITTPFRLILSEQGGRTWLRICNESTMREPALDLFLALRTPAGEILRREYSLLFDPSQGVAAGACVPEEATALAPAQAAQATQRPRRALPPPPPMSRDEVGPVPPGTVLGTLAQAVRGARPLPLWQVMDALYQANPQAFSGSPDRLIAGSRLQVPDLDAMLPPQLTPPDQPGQPEAIPAPPPATAEVLAVTPDPAVLGHPQLRMSFELSVLPPADAPLPAAVMRDTAADSSALPTAAPVAPAVSSGALDRLRGLPWIEGLAGLVLAAALLALRRRRPSPPTTAAPSSAVATVAPVLPPSLPQPVSAVSPPRAARVAVPASAPESPIEAGTDFYDEVAALLQSELRKHPDRRDLRYRLIDLLHTAGRREAFIEQAQHYRDSLDGSADEHWPEIARMARHLVPELGLHAELGRTPARATVVPIAAARSAARRFYESADPVALDLLRRRLQTDYAAARADESYWVDLQQLTRGWTSPTPGLTRSDRLTQYFGGAGIVFRDERRRPAEDTAALVAFGQVLLARRIGMRRVVAGGMRHKHGLAVAHAARQLGLECTLHLSERERADHIGVLERVGGGSLSVESVRESFLSLASEIQLQALTDALQGRQSLYISPAAAGPPPYPAIIVDLVSWLGRGLRQQMVETLGRVADVLVVHDADELHTVGLLHPFLERSETQLVCVEQPEQAAARMFSREHRLMRATGRVDYQQVADDVARFTAQFCAERRYADLDAAGSQVFAATIRLARDLPADQCVVAVLPSERQHGAAMESPGTAATADRRGPGLSAS